MLVQSYIYGTRTVRSATVVYIRVYVARYSTVPYRTVHQLTCRVDGGAARWVCVLYCTALHVDTGALIFGRDAFRIRSKFVWVSFGIRSGCLPSCSPPCMHAGRQQVLVPVRYFIPRVFVHLSYQGPGVGRTVLYCTTCKYGSPHFRTVCVRDFFAMRSICVRYAFGMRSGCVRDAFGMPAFLPVSLHACRQQ